MQHDSCAVIAKVATRETETYTRILDCFVTARYGVDLQQLSNFPKILKKMKVYYASASPKQRISILNELPWLRSHVMQTLTDQFKYEPLPTSLRFITSEKLLRLSKSPVWESQNQFYETSGITAWSIVPHEVSSNCFVAEYYGNLIDDIFHQRALSKDRSVCVIELGAGHGILSYLLAKEMRKVCYNLEWFRYYRSPQSLQRGYSDYSVLCTDFHGNSFKDLLKLPWIR